MPPGAPPSTLHASTLPPGGWSRGHGALTWCWYPFHLAAGPWRPRLSSSEQVEGREEPPWLQSGSVSGWEGLAVGAGRLAGFFMGLQEIQGEKDELWGLGV